MPPAYVKPYVKRQKNDMADAASGLSHIMERHQSIVMPDNANHSFAGTPEAI
jgi:hypothetical protein